MHFWAFMCWNCYRFFPWLSSLEAEFAAEPVTMVDVHTPELDSEKGWAAVAWHAKKYKIDHAYWNAMNNRYRPTY